MKKELSHYHFWNLMKYTDSMKKQDDFKRKITSRPKTNRNNGINNRRSKKR